MWRRSVLLALFTSRCVPLPSPHAADPGGKKQNKQKMTAESELWNMFTDFTGAAGGLFPAERNTCFLQKETKPQGNPVPAPAKRFCAFITCLFPSSPPHGRGRWAHKRPLRAQSISSTPFQPRGGGAGHLAVVMFLPCLAHVNCLIECLQLCIGRPAAHTSKLLAWRETHPTSEIARSLTAVLMICRI